MTQSAVREVLQVGDVAGVARTLEAGIAALPNWSVRSIQLADPSGTGKLRKALDIPSRGLTARRQVRLAVRQRRPDIVHIHWARYAPFIGSLGCPTVIHAHGSDVRGRSTTLSGRIVRAALDRADAVLVSTPDLIADVGSNGLYLPNPIDTERFAPLATSTRTNGQPTILLFSRLIDVKGATTLLEAARIMLSTIPGLRVLAFSGGAHDAEGIASGVEFLPHQSHSALPAILSSVDVVVGQQLLGSLGLAELEAMSCGRPVVTFVHAGLYPETLPIVSAKGANEVAEACSQLLNDDALARDVSLQAREYVLENHDRSVVCNRLVNIFEGLL